MAPTATKYKHVGEYAQALEGGAVLAPGEETTLSKDDLGSWFTQHLIDDGILVDVKSLDASQDKASQDKGEEA